MTYMYSTMFRAGADAKRQAAAEQANAAADYMQNAAMIKDQTRFLGFSDFNGRRCGRAGRR